MSAKEEYGTRDLSYSRWHRRDSIKRFIDEENAKKLSKIDVDVCIFVEYADNLKIPLLLIEVAMDVGQEYKTATVTKSLANRAGIPAFVLLYKISKTQKNPANTENEEYFDIKSFRYKSIGAVSPTGFIDREWVFVTPQDWGKLLVRARDFSAKKLGIYVP